ncbi:MAG: isoprenyl transferase [Planctomycetota bacterium]|nr:MAG: isoprenyl transferase [Planctomycetota bacterium]
MLALQKLEKTSEEKLKETAKRLGVALSQMPRHIAIIMDGNGRWAQKKNLLRAEGHYEGGKTVEKIAQYCVDFGIEYLTLYSFSIENWKRPKAEVNTLMHIYARYLVEIRPTLMKNNVRLIHLGRLAQLPPAVKRELAGTIKMTAGNSGMVLAVALNYGGRAEIADATRKIAQKYKEGKLRFKDIDEQCIGDHLYTAGLAEPDLLIRTANEMRVSNFLLWQISYSEFYVTKTLWPDFKKSDLEKAILAYAKRERRFGDTKGARKHDKGGLESPKLHR